MLQNRFSLRNLNVAVTHALHTPRYLAFLQMNVLPSPYLPFIFLPPALFRCVLSAIHIAFSNTSLCNAIHWLSLLLISMPQYLLNLYHSNNIITLKTPLQMKAYICFSITIFVNNDNEYLPVPKTHKFIQELRTTNDFQRLGLATST